MKVMSPCLMALAILGFGSGLCPASANSSLDDLTPMSMVEALRPETPSAHHLNAVADRIQCQGQAPSDALTLDLRQLPVVGALLDEKGNLNLPLGLTVYNTMGDTSIGFGTQF